MLFDLDIDFNEYDLYNEETKNKLNQKMMSLGFVFKGEIPTRDDIILQYYKLNSLENDKLIEYLVSFTYYTRDVLNYILENVELSETVKKNEIINISNRENWLGKLPKNKNLENLYEQGRFGGILND